MKQFYFVGLCIAFTLTANAQSKRVPNASDNLLSQIPGKYLSSVQAKASRVQDRLDQGSRKALKKMDKLEKQLLKRLEKADPSRVSELFGPQSNKISNLKNKMLSAFGQAGIGSDYADNYTDTLQNSLAFLEGTNLNGLLKGNKIEAVQKGVKAVKDKLNVSETLHADLQERKKQLTEALANIGGSKKLLGKLGKQVSYYNQHINDCKDILKNPSKAEAKVQQLLREYKPFNQYMQKYSVYASLFNINMNEDPTRALQGLQGRDWVDQRILTGLGSDPSARQAFSQQMERARSIIDEAKAKLPGGSGSVGDLPEQQLNPMKTKRFFQRLEYGANIQSQRSNNLLPTMTDIALQAGYKFNSNAVAGIGMVYKLGWGKSLSHFQLTNEGIGIRSFGSYKLKGRIHAMAGFEYNYFMRINTVDQLKGWNGWTKSTLAGVKIMIRENSKPKASLILLYDFQAARTVPASNPLKIRYQYTL